MLVRGVQGLFQRSKKDIREEYKAYPRIYQRVGITMDKCDKCEQMARVTVSGFIVARYLCARHASELCASVGDMAGVEKFNALIEGDKVLA